MFSDTLPEYLHDFRADRHAKRMISQLEDNEFGENAKKPDSWAGSCI
jgi:hypothetical protein